MTQSAMTHAFVDELRAHTQEPHKRLESLAVSASIINPNLSIAEYAHYLQLMRAVIAETEASVFPKAAKIIGDLESRRKLDGIDDDLFTLGADIRIFPNVFEHPDSFSEAHALGMLYTVEGSTLGGRLILRNVESALGFDENNGARFFFGYGNQTGLMWKQFLVQLEAAACTDPAGIIAGAHHAFDAIYNHFSAHPL